MDERPSGWYDDPDEPSRLRYWDGASWTERTNPKAPIPAPLPPRPPVDRLRPTRVEPSAGPDTAVVEPDRSGIVPAVDAPRPWSQDRAGDPHGDTGVRRRGRYAEDGARFAPFWRRVIALVIDWVLVGFLVSAAAVPFLGDTVPAMERWVRTAQAASLSGTAPTMPAELATAAAAIMLAWGIALVLYDVALHSWRGATIGKLLTGVRVRAGDGHRPASVGHNVRRAFLKWAWMIVGGAPVISTIAAVFGLVDWLWPLSEARRRALHDVWSETEVVRRR